MAKTVSLLDQAAIMRAEGAKWAPVKELFAKKGVKFNHVATELHVLKFQVFCGQFGGAFPAGVKADEGKLGKAIVAARAEGQSWGVLAARAGVPESRVRKLFELNADHVSQGVRIGRGGRFYMGEPDLYQAELNPTGTQLTPEQRGKRAEAIDAAATQRLLRLDRSELRSLATDLGITFTGRTTPAKLVTEIRKAMTAPKAPKAVAPKPEPKAIEAEATA